MAPARPAARDPLDGPVVVRRPGPPYRTERRVRGRRETQEPHRPGHGARPRPAAHARRRCTLPVPWVQLAGFTRGTIRQRKRIPRGSFRAYMVGLEPGPPMARRVRGGAGGRAQAQSRRASLVVRHAAVVAERTRLRRRCGRSRCCRGRLRRPAGESRLRPARIRWRRPADRVERPRDAPAAAQGASRDRPVRDGRRDHRRSGGYPGSTESPPRRVRRDDPDGDLQLAGCAPRQLRPAGRGRGSVGAPAPDWSERTGDTNARWRRRADQFPAGSQGVSASPSAWATLTPTRRHGGSSRSLPRSTSPARDGELESFARQTTFLVAPPDGLEPPSSKAGDPLHWYAEQPAPAGGPTQAI